MRQLLFSSLITCALGIIPGLAAESHSFSVQDLVAMSRLSDARVSPDGKQVAFTVTIPDLEQNKSHSEIHVAALDGSRVKRLTSAVASSSQARWAGSKAIYFLSARTGSVQVWTLALDGSKPRQVTKLPLDVGALEVAPDGKSLLISMAVFPGKTPEETQRILRQKEKTKASGLLFDHLFVRHWDTWNDGTRNHVFTYDSTNGMARDLMASLDADCPTKPYGGGEDFAVTPDQKTLVFSAKDMGTGKSTEAWSTNFDLFQVPFDGSAAPRRITTNPAWDAQPKFSPDGRTLAYLAMTRPGFEADRYEIVLRDWASGREEKFTLRVDETPRGDRSPSSIAWSADGRTLHCLAEHLGQNALFAVDVASHKARILVGEGTLVGVQPATGGRLLYGMNSLLGPTELYTVDPEGKDTRRVTHFNDAKVAATRLGRPERFTFEGAKGDTVYGYLVYPADFDPAKKYPVVMLIHGGPQGVFGNDFHYRWNPQAYAGAGYAVLMIDFHGSTSYGQAFTDAIRDDWGGAPFEDLMKGLDFALAKYPFLDKDRLGALGASYGGYMINWIAGHTDRFKCLVCHDGNLDERMAYYDTEELWFPEWEHMGTPWDNPAGYNKPNPIEFVKNWQTPMLVVHGMKDFRIAYSQGLSTFTALQRKGIPSKLLLFPDENHWVLRPANSVQWHETVLGWLDQWLKP